MDYLENQKNSKLSISVISVAKLFARVKELVIPDKKHFPMLTPVVPYMKSQILETC